MLVQRFAITVLLVAVFSQPAAALTFADTFTRVDGPVKNGWLALPNSQGSLVIKGAALTTGTLQDNVGAIYRKVGKLNSITVSADVSDENGYGGLLNRYQTQFGFGQTASPASGYQVFFGRSDQNYSNSNVSLLFYGFLIGTQYSSFQFGHLITPTVTLLSDGTVTGKIVGDGNQFDFSFAPRGYDFFVTTFSIGTEGPDCRAGPCAKYPTIDNVIIKTSNLPVIPAFAAGPALANVPEPESWAMLIAGFGLTGAAMRRRVRAAV